MKHLRAYALSVTAIIGGLVIAAIWVEPITHDFSLGGHLGAMTGAIVAAAFFFAVFMEIDK